MTFAEQVEPPPLPAPAASASSLGVLPITVDDPLVSSGVRVPLSKARLGHLYYCRVAGTIDDGYGGFVLAAAVEVSSSGVRLQSLYAGEKLLFGAAALDFEVIAPAGVD